MRPAAPRLNAFTFVEILAAMVFLGVLVPVIVSAILTANRAGIRSERSMLAAQLAHNRLNELMLANAWTSTPSRGDFLPDWPGYQWEVKQADWQSGSMTELSLSVSYQVQGTTESIRLTTLVNPSLTGTGT